MAGSEPVLAGQPPCTYEKSTRGEILADHLHTWGQVNRWYRIYARCENATAQEGYSEAVGRLLADRWGTLPQLLSMIKADPKFRPFVLGCVNATLDIEDVKKIRNHALKRCPAGAASFCAALNRSAEEALAEDDSSRKPK